MRLLSPEARILLRKELIQLRRTRGALISATILPFLLLIFVPAGNINGIRAGAGVAALGSASTANLRSGESGELFLYFLFPVLVGMTGLLVPSLAAVYTVVTERERRTLELLVALPVRVRDILTAKLAANLILSGLVTFPFFLVDAIYLLVTGTGAPLYVVTMLVLLISAMAASIGVSLLLALLARDFRTANNLNGLFSLPALSVSGFVLLRLGGEAGLMVMAAMLLILGGAAIAFAIRWLTFERYLS